MAVQRHHQPNCSDYPVIAVPQKYPVTATLKKPLIAPADEAVIAEKPADR